MTNLNVEFEFEVISEGNHQSKNWQVASLGGITFDNIDLTFKNKFLDSVFSCFSTTYNQILKYFVDSISGLVDKELSLLNHQIQEVEDTKRFELPFSNNSMFLNMTPLHAPLMQ